jgi:tetratricopeptide (TPR) repeat protein
MAMSYQLRKPTVGLPYHARIFLIRRRFLFTSLTVLLCISMSAIPVLGQTDLSALKREAAVHMDAGRYGEAIALLDKYLARNPDEADAYRMRGLCYQGRGQLEPAVADFRKALSLNRNNQQLQNLLSGAEKTLRGRANQRIEGYKRELARSPNDPAPYLLIAQEFRAVEAWPDAGHWYEEYFKRTDGTPEEILQYGEVLAKMNLLQKGEDFLELSTKKFPRNAQLSSRHGYFLLWLGKFQSAEKEFEKALSLAPSLSEAQEGLEQVHAAERAPRPSTTGGQRSQAAAETPIDNWLRTLHQNPFDDEARFSLVQELFKANRFDEAFRNLDTLAIRNRDTLRIRDARMAVTMRRETVYRARIDECLSALKEEPTNKGLLLQVAGLYAELGDYQNALDYVDRVLKGTPQSEGSDIRFRYAQYAAWGQHFTQALAQLEPLLSASPGNLDYQLLRGQIAVWSHQDIDVGVRYLSNVVRLSPKNVPALVALSSALALQGDFTAAHEYLERAKKIDPYSRAVQSGQQFYDEARRTDAERANYAMLESARELTASGDCLKAVGKYEEYMAKVSDPGKAVLLAYADVLSCAKNQSKAIEVCDKVLAQGYDYDVAITRAKYILWSGDSLRALREFKQLTQERPSDFQANLYLGESYQRLNEYDQAREVYQRLLDKVMSEDERTQVASRMKFLPLTGLSAAFSASPTRLALAPPVTYYSDNQEFSLASYGGRLEIGLASALSVGGSYGRTLLQSPFSSRYFTESKGQLFIRLPGRLNASGDFGVLRSEGRMKKYIGDASVVYERLGVLRVAASFEANDAALMLYSPYLIDFPYDARLYKAEGYYNPPSGWVVGGMYRIITVSDGNRGSDLQLRLGHIIYDGVNGGYEYAYSDFYRQAPWIPFTNHAKQLYYTPQNFESHSVWVAWRAEKDQDMSVNIGGKFGYVPSFHAGLREVTGDLTYMVASPLLLTGSFAIGNTYRSDGGYNYVSAAFSLYWSVF